jgi:hypothetical protein
VLTATTLPDESVVVVTTSQMVPTHLVSVVTLPTTVPVGADAVPAGAVVVFDPSMVDTVPAVAHELTPPMTIGRLPAAQVVASFGMPLGFVVDVETPDAAVVAAVGRFGEPPVPAASP